MTTNNLFCAVVFLALFYVLFIYYINKLLKDADEYQYIQNILMLINNVMPFISQLWL